MSLESWGRYPKAEDQTAQLILSRYDLLPLRISGQQVLPRGLGRSYGDSCLNDHNTLLLTKNLDHFIEFDSSSGVLTSESGVSLARILEIFVPKGWFLPVTPGTKFVTLGGAIANDVHGKNHHVAGNFGRFILDFEILRSDGKRLLCSRTENADLFHATIGGLGLTGLITWARIQLKKIESSWISQEQIRFESLEEFLKLSQDSMDFEYTVSWVDCLSSGADLRGIFIRGDHVSHSGDERWKLHRSRSKVAVPFDFPAIALNACTVKTFNSLYYHKNYRRHLSGITHYDSFFYPLDAIQNWNKIYGRRGFLQYQFVVPFEVGSEGLTSLLNEIKKSQLGSFLAVLKTFGSIPSEGLLSFPQEGVTLALDFPQTGHNLFRLLERCDALVAELGGRVYPAKDARMSALHFKKFFPQLSKFEKFVDPQFSSTFWRRVR